MEKREMECKKPTSSGAQSPNPRAKPPPPLSNGKISCFELKTRNNGGGAAGRKKGWGIFIENLTEVVKHKINASVNVH